MHAKRLIKQAAIQASCCLAMAVVLYLFVGSILVCGLIAFILLALVAIRPAVFVLNKLSQRTNWYKNQLEEIAKFRRPIPLGLDICNLGSTSGKYAFSYEDTELKGVNWAISPQTLSYDFRILKNYFSYLKEGATVLIPLCPFSGCIKDFAEDSVNHKYYSFLHPVTILNYSKETRRKANRFVDMPFLVSPFVALKRLVKDVSAKSDLRLATNPMSSEELEADAVRWIESWKKQFSISDLEAPASKSIIQCLKYNAHLLAEMISYCLERGLKPVLVLPPTTLALSSKFSERFCDTYIYSMVRDASARGVPFLNYLRDDRFTGDEFFFNSFFLNVKGRKVFTDGVLSDLEFIAKKESPSFHTHSCNQGRKSHATA